MARAGMGPIMLVGSSNSKNERNGATMLSFLSDVWSQSFEQIMFARAVFRFPQVEGSWVLRANQEGLDYHIKFEKVKNHREKHNINHRSHRRICS